ncbi:hypothetical protein RSO01_63520 [Reyranella soli]|uniref:Uncharacterized protein n=1 Tax=Reyranella soli TaxID=1230389 RepID=A0A512NJR3_9HYPH|nr:hypothetical protein RSO01_63520 [Reyranella soli]
MFAANIATRNKRNRSGEVSFNHLPRLTGEESWLRLPHQMIAEPLAQGELGDLAGRRHRQGVHGDHIVG